MSGSTAHQFLESDVHTIAFSMKDDLQDLETLIAHTMGERLNLKLDVQGSNIVLSNVHPIKPEDMGIFKLIIKEAKVEAIFYPPKNKEENSHYGASLDLKYKHPGGGGNGFTICDVFYDPTGGLKNGNHGLPTTHDGKWCIRTR